jgi:phage pi2 protein 07
MRNSFWFKGHRGLAICFGILMFVFSTLLPVSFGVWSIAGSGNPVTPITHSLLHDKDFRDTAGAEFVRQLSKDATGAEKDLFAKKGKKISTAVSNLLNQPEFETGINKISEGLYSFYANSSQESVSIDVKPIAQMTLTALTKVENKFKILKKELNKLKPIELKPQTSGPDIAQMRKILNLFFFVLITFFILVNILYFRYAKTLTGALRMAGSQFIYMGLITLAINIIGNSLANSAAVWSSQPLTQIAIPIVAKLELGIFSTLGFAVLLAGLVLQVLSFTKFSKPKAIISPILPE